MPLYASLFFCALLVAAAVSDLRSFRIPNLIPIALAIGALALDMPETGGELVSRVGSAVVLGSVAVGLYMANGLGGGDVKLLAAAGLWAPLSTLPAFVLSLGIAGGVQALAVLAWMRLRTAGAPATGFPAMSVEPARLPYAVSIAAAGLFWLWWQAAGKAAYGA